MVCSECGKKMIKTGTGVCLTSNPPIYPQIWWCGCGYTKDTESIRGKTEEESRLEEWKKLNEIEKTD